MSTEEMQKENELVRQQVKAHIEEIKAQQEKSLNDQKALQTSFV